MLEGKGADSCGSLRSTDPKYLRCVKGWYTALAAQLKGLYHKDGGPIVFSQVDNETTDWKYLLALRSMAMSLGVLPAFYTKTGWPGPGAGYPADYPMLPFFGGYPDAFWSGMSTAANPAQYSFESNPSAALSAHADGAKGPETTTSVEGETKASTRSLGGWDIPDGYPWLDVEIGGGMAAAYNHRVHLNSSDMYASFVFHPFHPRLSVLCGCTFLFCFVG